MSLGPEIMILATLAICLGAVLQAATGLGAGMVSFPLLALISLKLVPGPLIFASFFLSIYMAYKGRSNIRYSSMDLLALGIVIGTIIGGYSLSVVPVEQLGVFFGALLLTVVIISVFGRKMKYNKTNMLSLGAAAGFMGITVASGSPFVALLYQHEDGPTIRATLALIYMFGSILTLSILNWANLFGYEEVLYGLYLTPGFLLGYFVSGKLASYIDKGYSRMIILIISSCSAMALIVKHIY